MSTYLGHDLAVLNDSPQLVHDGGVNVRLLADHRVVLVVGIVGIPKTESTVNNKLYRYCGRRNDQL